MPKRQSDSSDSSSEEEKVQVKNSGKGDNTKKAKVNEKKPDQKKVSKKDESSDSSSDDEPKKPTNGKASVNTPAKGKVPAKTATPVKPKDDSGSSSSDDEPQKVAPVKAAQKMDESSDSSSEEEKEAKKPEKRKAGSEEVEAPKKAKTENGAIPVSSGTSDIFIGNLPFSITEDQLKEFLEGAGIEMLAVKWGEDRSTGQFKGYGWATVPSLEQAQKAVEALQGADLGGRAVRLDLSSGKAAGPKPGGDRAPGGDRPPAGPSTTVFLGNCSFDITEEALKEALADCGEIVSVRWSTDRDTGRFKGIGFAEFDSVESAQKAVDMTGLDIMGRSTKIEFSTPRTGGGGGGGFGGGGFGGGRGGSRGGGRGGSRGGPRGRGGNRGRGNGGRGNGGSRGTRTTFE